MKEYDHQKIEKKWQAFWEKNKIYQVKDRVKGKENFYTLVEFAYPSGNLHVGHWYAFGVTDIFARFKRMQGFNVLFPMGFDAFGLPAENAAINQGADPKVLTYKQIKKMRTQFHSMGAMFDWGREIISCDPEYYKWTQWMFNKFLQKDLVYRDVTKVNWCPKDKTILANEQVTDGHCERCGSEVEQRDQEQWMLRITKYADRLIDDLDKLAWPEEIKSAQKNWIGRSEGAEIDFKIRGDSVKVFTTRPDTIFGATYLVLAPEHEMVQRLKPQIINWDEVEKYIVDVKKKSELDRQQSKEKTGVELKGIKAINPANKEEIPVWIADYVLASYGTGAIMAVPAHDERDFAFAKKYNLPIKYVIAKYLSEQKYPTKNGKKTVARKVAECYVRNPSDDSFLFIESKGADWRSPVCGGVEEGEDIVEAARREIKEETGYKNLKFIKHLGAPLRADFFHPQKDENREAEFHGVFFELENEERDEISQHELSKQNPVWLPRGKVASFLTMGLTLFNRINEDNLYYSEEGILVGSGQFNNLSSAQAKKEIIKFVEGKATNTYRLRDWGISRQRYWGCPIPIVYDPEGKAHPVPDKYLPWLLPKDVDHTPDGTSPLARSKELFKRTEKIFGKGWKPEVETMDTFVDSSWYFYRYLDSKNKKTFADVKHRDAWMPIDLYMGGAEHTTMHLLYSRFWVKAMYDLGLVKEEEAYKVRRNRGLILGPDGNKMSKSKGNVIDPDEIVDRLGADTVRMYLAFMGPYGVTVNYPWDPNGVVGVRRFLERVWNIKEKIGKGTPTTFLHKAIKKMTEDMAEYKFNTSITQMMILLNEWEKISVILESEYKIFLQLLAPFAPHFAEELWNSLGGKQSIHVSKWPVWDESLIIDKEIKIVIQVNGKLRAEINVPKDTDESEIKKQALVDENVKKNLQGKEPKKVIYVKNRLINIVV